MATRLCVILYSIVTLAMFLRVSRVFHSRWSSNQHRCHAASVVAMKLWSSPHHQKHHKRYSSAANLNVEMRLPKTISALYLVSVSMKLCPSTQGLSYIFISPGTCDMKI
jgi:hypothetical protein